MNNAGAIIKDGNITKKAVFLDKKLMPVDEGNIPEAISVIQFFYENHINLVRISFKSDDANLPDFNIEKKIIDRYLTLRRADGKAMEVLRKGALETKSLVTLKKFAFECIKYIA